MRLVLDRSYSIHAVFFRSSIINDMFCQGNLIGERKMVAFLVDCYFGAQGGRTETIFRYFGYLSICVVTECWWIACEIGL